MSGWVYDDGGRADAGYRGKTGDCAMRAIAIATEIPYQTVMDALDEQALRERPRGKARSSAKTGVHTRTFKRYVEGDLGWLWTPTMHIGSGCTVHVRPDELPSGRLILNLSRHFAAMVDGVVHDTYDPSRGGTRCVYGYWIKGGE